MREFRWPHQVPLANASLKRHADNLAATDGVDAEPPWLWIRGSHMVKTLDDCDGSAPERPCDMCNDASWAPRRM